MPYFTTIETHYLNHQRTEFDIFKKKITSILFQKTVTSYFKRVAKAFLFFYKVISIIPIQISYFTQVKLTSYTIKEQLISVLQNVHFNQFINISHCNSNVIS